MSRRPRARRTASTNRRSVIAAAAAERVSPPPAAGTGRLSVRVRMYRHGFGDCFLLSFTEWNSTAHMLIDCGVHAQSPDGAKNLREKVIPDLLKETRAPGTDKSALAVVAATHEHWDHVAGFSIAKKLGLFEGRMSVTESWTAWTEDPEHPVAKDLRDRTKKARDVLSASVALAERSGDGVGRGLRGLLGFSGLGAAGRGESGGDVRAAMEYAATLGSPRYLAPTDAPRSIPGVDGVRVFVLGPPKHVALLADDPRRGEGYPLAGLGGVMASLGNAVAAMSARRGDRGGGRLRIDPVTAGNGDDDPDRLCPFPPEFWLRQEPKRGVKFGRLMWPDEYTKRRWRWIDDDWVASCEDLALQLDNHTNNTSLVLAIQLPRSGKVLLFAGDAQAGNWRSWHDQAYRAEGPVGATAVRASDLLAKTVLYKVSHHGSKNATMRSGGLELMTHPDLVAMLPLQRRPLGERWHMPGAALEDALDRRTRGRVIWSDPDRAPIGGAARAAEFGLTGAEWDVFARSVGYGAGSPFVDFTVEDR